MVVGKILPTSLQEGNDDTWVGFVGFSLCYVERSESHIGVRSVELSCVIKKIIPSLGWPWEWKWIDFKLKSK